MAEDVFFAFDLDGTVTKAEILPALAREAGVFDEIFRLTAMTLRGEIPFEASFRTRFNLLRCLPVADAQRVTAAIPLDPHITAFIVENRDCCAIVTGNLDCWIAPLVETLGCAVYCSRSECVDGELALASVLDKGAVVRNIAGTGQRVIAIGDAANDIPMFMAADFGIAYGGVGEPAPGLLAAAHRVERDALSLCRLLRTIRDSGTIPCLVKMNASGGQGSSLLSMPVRASKTRLRLKAPLHPAIE